MALPKARFLAALFTLILAVGCQGLQPFSGSSDAKGGAIPPKPPARLALAGGGVVITAPSGYCIDEKASRTTSDLFVLLAPCAAISQSAAHPAPKRKGLLTATLGKAGSGNDPVSPLRLNNYFRSEEGRAILSNSGVAQSVQILDTQIRGNAFYIALSDSAAPRRPELGPTRWRAIFTVSGHLVSAMLYSLKENPIEREAGLDLLETFVERIKVEDPF